MVQFLDVGVDLIDPVGRGRGLDAFEPVPLRRGIELEVHGPEARGLTQERQQRRMQWSHVGRVENVGVAEHDQRCGVRRLGDEDAAGT